MQRVAQTAGKTLQAGLCAPVDVVGAANPNAGDGREHHDLSGSLSAHDLREVREDADLSHVVGVHHRDRMRRVGFGTRLIAENPEGQHCNRNPTVLGDYGAQEVSVRVDSVGVELDGGDVDSAGVFEHLLLLRQLSAASGSQNDVAARREPDRDLEADLTSSAEEQYRLDVIHVRTRSHRSSVLDYRRGMTLTPSTTPSSQQTLTEDGLKFVGEYHLATLTTLRPNGTPHVVAVGFTWDQEAGKARVITSGGSQKAINAARGGYAAVSSVDGGRWLTLEGPARVLTDADSVADAVRRYAERYRQPRVNPARVVIEIDVTRILGSAAFKKS